MTEDAPMDDLYRSLLDLEAASDRWWQEQDDIEPPDPLMPNATPGLSGEARRQQEIARLRHLLLPLP